MKSILNEGWRVKYTGGEEYVADVPASNLGVLIDNGIMPHPYYGLNEKEFEIYAEKDWIFTKRFDYAANGNRLSAAKERLELVFSRLDTVCDVYVNDVPVLHAENCHVAYRVDVTEIITNGANSIEIRFRSPVSYVIDKQKKLRVPINSNGLTGAAHIRKPQCHFGWDWGPNLPVCGILGDVYLESFSARIEDLYANQRHLADCVKLNVECSAIYATDECSNIEMQLLSPSGEILQTKLFDINDILHCDFIVKNPELWWTRELSGKDEQPLYTIEATLLNKNGERLDRRRIKIGLRTLRLNRDFDSEGQNFVFELNGVKLFAKGASVIPPDGIPDNVNDVTMRRIVDDALFANFNMLRIWGGGYYGDDALFDECDRRGLLIWQDFMFACQAYPFFTSDFEDNVTDEVKRVVKRLRNHPSLALWCGNNEIEQMSNLWRTKTKFIRSAKRFFYETVPEIVKNMCDTSYIPSSPIGIDYLKGINADNTGDTHLWAVWHGLKPSSYFHTRRTRFCSEFGFESMPDYKTMLSFADKSDLNMRSAAFNSHQKCKNGNQKTLFYVSSRFRIPKRFDELAYLSQLCQSECIADAVGNWRKNKGTTNGALYWQFNDCWPTCSWSGIDYYGNYKALHYAAKHFFAPVALYSDCVKKCGKTVLEVSVLNDSSAAINGILELCVKNFDGKVLLKKVFEQEFTAQKSTTVQAFVMNEIKRAADLKNCYLSAILTVDGIKTATLTSLFENEKNTDLKNCKPNADVKIKDGTAYITLNAPHFLRKVRISSALCSARFSDNFTDLEPNVPLTVEQYVGTEVSEEEYARSLSFMSVTDVKDNRSKAYGLFCRAKLFLRPMVFGQWFYYGIEPKRTKLKK